MVLAALIRERTQSVNTAIGCGILIDILRKSQTDEAKSAAAECLARLAHMKSGERIRLDCLALETPFIIDEKRNHSSSALDI